MMKYKKNKIWLFFKNLFTYEVGYSRKKKIGRAHL